MSGTISNYDGEFMGVDEQDEWDETEKADKDHLYRLMLAGDRIRRFGAWESGDCGARFSEFARSQPLGVKWSYSHFVGWMIEDHPDEVKSWLKADLEREA